MLEMARSIQLLSKRRNSLTKVQPNARNPQYVYKLECLKEQVLEKQFYILQWQTTFKEIIFTSPPLSSCIIILTELCVMIISCCSIAIFHDLRWLVQLDLYFAAYAAPFFACPSLLTFAPGLLLMKGVPQICHNLLFSLSVVMATFKQLVNLQLS